MVQRRIQKPRFDSSEERRGVYQDESNELVDTSGRSGQSALQDASAKAGGTIDDIDAMLNENDAAETPERSEALNNIAEQEQGGGFYKGAESSDKSASPGEVDQAESNPKPAEDSNAGGLFNPSGEKERSGFRMTRRKGILGGIASLVVGGGIFGASILSGPGQVLHLAQLFNHNLSKTQSDSSDRTTDELRYATALNEKDLNYTRVSRLGAKTMKATLAKLSDAGITIDRNALGNAKSIGVEPEKTKAKLGQPNMSDEDFRSFLKENFHLTSDSQIITNKDGSITLKGASDTFKLQDMKPLVRDAVVLASDGKTPSFLKMRTIGEFFGLGSLFHPFSRALNNKVNGQVNRAEEQKLAEEQRSGVTDPTEEKGVAAAEKTKAAFEDQESGFRGAATKSIAFYGVAIAGACAIKGTASAIVELNYFQTVAPAMLEAVNLMAIAGQIQYGGSDLTLRDVGAVTSDFTDSTGKTIWQSPAIQSLENEKPAGDGLGGYSNDLPNKYRQAFSSHNTENTLISASNAVLAPISAALAGATLGLDSDPCSLFSQLTLAAVSGIITVASAAASGGTSAAAVAALDSTESALFQTFVIGGVINHVQKDIIDNNTTGKLAGDELRGPVGGGLEAFGARYGSDLTAIASGGIEITNTASKTLIGRNDESTQQFQSESMFARVFDANDYRSVTGRLADMMSPNFATNIMQVGDGITNIGSSITGLFSSLMPGVSANSLTDSNSWTGDYPWGFSQYGIPDTMLNEPNLQDPYANATDVTNYLNGACKDSNGNIGTDKGDCANGQPGGNGITGRIKACFGNDLTYTPPTGDAPGLWDIAPEKNNDGININSNTYQDADCGDIGRNGGLWAAASSAQQTWQRVIMWINDSSNLKAIDCYAGDSSDPDTQQSCQELGAESSTDSSSSSAAPSGDLTQLAQQVLANSNIQLDTTAKADIQATANGQKVTPGPISGQNNGTASTGPCSARTPVFLDPTLLKGMLEIAAKYKYEIGDITSGHDCDTGRHPLGRAMDIFTVNGKKIDGHCTDSDIYTFLQDTTNIMSKLQPNGSFVNGRPINMSGIGSCNPAEDNHNTPSWVPNNINYFFDATDEIHVDTGFPS